MSNACKCDRCGGYFDYKERYQQIRSSEQLYKKNDPIISWLRGADWRWVDNVEWEKDLCPECYEKLILFLDGADIRTED